MTITALVLTGLAGTGFLAIGLAAIFKPAILSHLYGVYVHDERGRAFVRAAGIRDVALGMLVFAFSAQHMRTALMCVLAAGMLVAAADFVLVWCANRSFQKELTGHAAGFLFLALVATIVGIGGPTR